MSVDHGPSPVLDRSLHAQRLAARSVVALIGLSAALALRRSSVTSIEREQRAWRDQLHHRVVQPLLAADRSLARGECESARALVQEALGQSRLLHGTASEDADPAPIVEAAARDSARLWGPDLDVTTAGIADVNVRLGRARRRLLHDVTTEALANVAKHRPGSTARVGLSHLDGHVLLTIASAGTGGEAERTAPEAPAPGGYGLARMRGEIQRCGGRLLARSDGNGSVLVAIVPTTWRGRWRPRSIVATMRSSERSGGRRDPVWAGAAR